MFTIKCFTASAVLNILIFCKECNTDPFLNLDPGYYLVQESYAMTKEIFNRGGDSYSLQRDKSRATIDTFLDLITIMNDKMAEDLRSAVLKYYKISYLKDFTDFTITLDEIVDIVDHCLVDPVEKAGQIRDTFHRIIRNFGDVRNFSTVEKCYNEMPDEVAVAHCLLHQAVLFNQTMQESLIKIVEIKTRQYAQDMNSSIHEVRNCLTGFVPKFFEKLLLDAYCTGSDNMKIVKTCTEDLIQDTLQTNLTGFADKWKPMVVTLQNKSKSSKELSEELSLPKVTPENVTAPE